MSQHPRSASLPSSDVLLDRLVDAIHAHAPLRTVSTLYAAWLVATVGNKVHVAQKLGIDRKTIQRWLRFRTSLIHGESPPS